MCVSYVFGMFTARLSFKRCTHFVDTYTYTRLFFSLTTAQRIRKYFYAFFNTLLGFSQHIFFMFSREKEFQCAVSYTMAGTFGWWMARRLKGDLELSFYTITIPYRKQYACMMNFSFQQYTTSAVMFKE